ncbi:docking protein 2 [Mugil cephalus]|uniref:docking protein 2 n=1 Tax=Mugil cephalus TaxID=48193 RepID=UPI001FB6427B|nr:docking protein 2 [Mugil cephalus]
MDVIYKEELMYLQTVKFGKRTWRKIRMVLFKPSSTGVGRLELLPPAESNSITDQMKVGRQKTPERKVVRLSDCLSVTLAQKESCPAGCAAFYLNTTQTAYTFASATAQDWLDALSLLAFQKDPGEADKGDFDGGNGFTMEDNDLYSSWKRDVTLPPNQFKVTVQSTEASRRCRLTGEYLVCPDIEAVTLLDISTGYTIYSWPYCLLRKFGQVEAGFSIEAGRRCDSGAGVFTFLTRHGSQIFQVISKQCAMEREAMVQPVTVHRRSSSDITAAVLRAAPSNRPAGPPVYNTADDSGGACDSSADVYSTVTVKNMKRLSLVRPNAIGMEGAEDADDGEVERCHSLGALSLCDDVVDSIYYNLRRSTPPLPRKDQSKSEGDISESIYSDVKKKDSPTDLDFQASPSSLTQLEPQAPPFTPAKSGPYVPKPRTQLPPPTNASIQPGYSTQSQAVDDMTETEEPMASVAPTEPPGSFKHRLAEILSKDLAKFQPPLPYGESGPTFSNSGF